LLFDFYYQLRTVSQLTQARPSQSTGDIPPCCLLSVAPMAAPAAAQIVPYDADELFALTLSKRSIEPSFIRVRSRYCRQTVKNTYRHYCNASHKEKAELVLQLWSKRPALLMQLQEVLIRKAAHTAFLAQAERTKTYSKLWMRDSRRRKALAAQAAADAAQAPMMMIEDVRVDQAAAGAAQAPMMMIEDIRIGQTGRRWRSKALAAQAPMMMIEDVRMDMAQPCPEQPEQDLHAKAEMFEIETASTTGTSCTLSRASSSSSDSSCSACSMS